MSDLSSAVAIFGKPYSITKSLLGSITRIYDDKYICDPNSLKELYDAIGQKIITLKPTDAGFSFLISYSDKTHHEGIITDLQHMKQIPTGKITNRIVLKWIAKTLIDGEVNDVAIIVRINNPINPLLYLQAALSKSASEIDTIEFEMGSTCVTVDGTGQMFADETFLIIQNWINARNKPHAFISVDKYYKKFEWLIDQFSSKIFPFFIASIFGIMIFKSNELKFQLALIPISIISFKILSSLGDDLNQKMFLWSKKTKYFSMFQLTNGDVDCISKMAAKSTNSSIKLILASFLNLSLNIIAAIICYYIFKMQ